MIKTTVLTLFKRLPFRWYELLFGGMLIIGVGVIWYQSQRIDALDQQATLDQQAIDAAIKVNTLLTKRQEIDQSIVLDWMSAREAYREKTRKTIDTTFLDYFNLPFEEPADVAVPAPVSTPTPSVTTPTTHTPMASPPQALSDRQLDILADGMWDVYCQTGTTDPNCLP